MDIRYTLIGPAFNALRANRSEKRLKKRCHLLPSVVGTDAAATRRFRGLDELDANGPGKSLQRTSGFIILRALDVRSAKFSVDGSQTSLQAQPHAVFASVLASSAPLTAQRLGHLATHWPAWTIISCRGAAAGESSRVRRRGLYSLSWVRRACATCQSRRNGSSTARRQQVREPKSKSASL